MGPMQVMIFGDIDFAYFILNGITMMYANDATFIKAAFVLSMLFLLWSYIKWSMNPEKNTYPIREWGFGLIFFLIFGGTDISPKVDVQLHSANTPGLFKSTITDVPIIAAVPSWLATNLFYSITKVIHETGSLIMPGYERLRGTGIIDKPDADPLNALVRLNTYTASSTLSPAMEKAIKDYIEQCYILEKSYNAADSKFGFTEKLVDERIWDELKTNNIHFRVTSTDFTNSATIEESCIANHARIGSAITPDASGAISALALNKLSARGIHPDEIKYGYQIINQQLTGSAGSPNPYTIMVNMFLARSLKDTLNNSPAAVSMQTWAEKMVFEADRKRTFDSAGERSLFMKIYIPTITAIEAFSFYIAPILMIFSILGGFGFSFIGKYLMLIVFINLWSFIKAFVDIFTALALTKAFAPTNGDAAALKVHLSVMNFPQTLGEVESMLTMASNLTMAIPFFAMFLLYGGVHSVMGVMRTVTGSNVDGANMAPTMATTMNAGALQQGDTGSSLTVSTGQFSKTHTAGSNAWFGENSAGAGADALVQSGASTLKAQQDSATQSWNSSLTHLNAQMKQSLQSKSNADGSTSTEGSSSQQLFSLIDSNASSFSEGKSQSTKIAAQLMASAGASASVGSQPGKDTKSDDANAKTPLGLALSRLAKIGIGAELGTTLLGGMDENQLNQLNKLYTSTQNNATQLASSGSFDKSKAYTDLKGFTDSVTDSSTFTDMKAASQQIANLSTKQSQLTEGIGNSFGIASSKQLQFHRADSFDYKNFEDFYNKGLKDEDKKRIADLGYGNSAAAIAQKVQQDSGLGAEAIHGSVIGATLLSALNRGDGNLQELKTDAQISEKLYREFAKHTGDYSQGFLAAADYADRFAKNAEKISTASDAIKTPDTTNASTAEQNIQTGSQKIPKTVDRTDSQVPIDEAKKRGLATEDGSPTSQSGSAQLLGDTLLKPDQVKKGAEQLDTIDHSKVQTGFTPAIGTTKSVLNAVGDLAALFQDRDKSWGIKADEVSSNIAKFATNELGNKSLALESGMTSLTRADTFAEMPKLFSQLRDSDSSVRYEAATQIAQMNDAVKLLNTKEGVAMAGKYFDDEDLSRLQMNLQRFESQMSFNATGPLNKDTFNALSNLRMNGDFTNNNADTFLKVATGDGINVPGSNINQLYDDGQALKYMLMDSPKVQSNEDLALLSKNLGEDRQLMKNLNGVSAGYRAGSEMTNNAVLQNIAADEDKISSRYSNYSTNGVASGVNLEEDKQATQSATLAFIKQQLPSQTAEDVHDVNYQLMQRAYNGDTAAQDQIYGAVSTQSASTTAARFAENGFQNDANKINFALDAISKYATDTKLTIPQQDLTQALETIKDRAPSLPSYADALKTNQKE